MLAEDNRVLIPQNLRQLNLHCPFSSGIRKCSKVLVEKDDGVVSEVNSEDHWFSAKNMSKRQRKKLKDTVQLKMYAPKFDKTGDVFFEYISETEDEELAEKNINEAWDLFYLEQARRAQKLNVWLEQNNLQMLSSMYASHK